MSQPDTLIGAQMGGYTVIDHIARGGMADVYLARHDGLQRDVVLKILLPSYVENSSFVERFQREAQAMARLQHPNIVLVYDTSNTPDGRPYIAMQYVRGGTLETLLARLEAQGQVMTVSYALGVTRQVAIALQAAHAAGIIHRDLKPSNILLDDGGQPLLTDLGISFIQDTKRLTRADNFLGTPHYMSPEQGQGTPLDARSDIYSLGVVLFEMLAGTRPFRGDSHWALIHQHITEPPPSLAAARPGISKIAEAVVGRCLEKDPARRYQSAAELVAALDKALAELGGAVTQTPSEESRQHITGPDSQFVEIVSQVGEVRPKNVKREPRLLGNARQSLEMFFRGLWLALLNRFSITLSRTERYASNPSSINSPTIIPTTSDYALNTVEAEALDYLVTVPPHVTRPSLILRRQHDLLDPLRKHTVRELISHLDPERIVNHTLAYEKGRFILTGYGSFGGTSLVDEICQLIESQWFYKSGKEEILIIHLTNPYNEISNDNLIYKVETRLGEADRCLIDTFAEKPDPAYPNLKQLSEFLDALVYILLGKKGKSQLQRYIERKVKSGGEFIRLILTIDKVRHAETLHFFSSHKLFNVLTNTTLIAIVDREVYNRWIPEVKQYIKNKLEFQVRYAPCLWETKYGIVESLINSIFSQSQMESAEAEEKLQKFKKHIAFMGRGQNGAIFYELRQLRYWQIDKLTEQAYIAMDSLDDDLIRHNALVQDILDDNWDRILGRSFTGVEKKDRAKQGVYSLIDWIIDFSTFTKEEAIEHAGRARVLIAPHERLREDTVERLLDVLVENNYLKRVEGDFEIIWGRDVNERTPFPPKKKSDDQLEINLFNLLSDGFNEEELKTFCFQLKIEYEDLGGAHRRAKARELSKYLVRNKRIGEAVGIGRLKWPGLDWDKVLI